MAEHLIFLRPAPSRRYPDRARMIRMPGNGRHLLLEGEWVPRSAFWIRAIRDGDVEIAESPIAEKTTGRSIAKPELATED